MSKTKGLKTYEKILRVKVRLLNPLPQSLESLAVLSDNLFEFVHATSGEETTTSTEDESKRRLPSPPSFPPTTTTTVDSPRDINLSLEIEKIRLECDTEQYRAEISERRYKQLKLKHSQEISTQNSKFQETESQMKVLEMNVVETRNEWNEVRRSETRLANALKESDTMMRNEAQELCKLRESINRVMARCKKESVAAKRWMSQRQIAQVAANAAETKIERMREEASEANTRAEEFDAKCKQALKSASSSYEKFIHVSKSNSNILEENVEFKKEIDVMREVERKYKDVSLKDELVREELKLSLSEAQIELSKCKNRMLTEEHRSEVAQVELVQRISHLESSEMSESERSRKEFMELKQKLKEYELDREQSKNDFDELWQELCRSKELVKEIEAERDVVLGRDDEKDVLKEEESNDLLVATTPAIDLLRDLKGLASELNDVKSEVDKSKEQQGKDNGFPPPVPRGGDSDEPPPFDSSNDEKDNNQMYLEVEMLGQALLEQEVLTSNISNSLESSEEFASSLRREHEIQIEANSRQKAAIAALQISLKEEIELASSRSIMNNDFRAAKHEGDKKKDVLLRTNLHHANAEIVALRRELSTQRTSNSDLEHLVANQISMRDETIEFLRDEGLKVVPSNLLETTELMTSHLRESQQSSREVESNIQKLQDSMQRFENEIQTLRASESVLKEGTARLTSANRETQERNQALECENASSTAKFEEELKNYRRALQVSIEEIVERDDLMLRKQSEIRTLTKEVDEVRDALRVITGGRMDSKEKYLSSVIGTIHES